jgi:hypothetical protein
MKILIMHPPVTSQDSLQYPVRKYLQSLPWSQRVSKLHQHPAFPNLSPATHPSKIHCTNFVTLKAIIFTEQPDTDGLVRLSFPNTDGPYKWFISKETADLTPPNVNPLLTEFLLT